MPSIATNRSQRPSFPSALNSLERVMDVSDRPEVQLMMGFRQRMLDMFGDKDKVSSLQLLGVVPMELRRTIKARSMNFFKARIAASAYFSIAGGYPRNILLGIEGSNTDVDLLCPPIMTVMNMFDYLHERMDDGSGVVRTYRIPNNTMHVLTRPTIVTYSDRDVIPSQVVYGAGDRRGVEFISVNPVEFDFTINLSCIYSNDGFLYSPPAALHDIQNKVVRANVQLYSNFDRSCLLRLPLCIRVLRFALKYDMSIHKDLYLAVKAYFALTKERKTCDDLSMYHSLKHLCDDPPELRSELFMIMKKLGAYETERFSTFEDYFEYVSQMKKDGPRESRISCTSQDSVTY